MYQRRHIFCLKIDDVIESSDDEMEDTPKKNGEIQNVVKTVRRIGMKRTSGNPPKTSGSWWVKVLLFLKQKQMIQQ